MVAPTSPQAEPLAGGGFGPDEGLAELTPGALCLPGRERLRRAEAGTSPPPPTRGWAVTPAPTQPPPSPCRSSRGSTMPRLPTPAPADAPSSDPGWAGRPGAGAGRGDSRVAHVDPWGDLVAGLAGEAVAAAAVREQVVEILHRELERAGHGGGRALHAGAAASEGRAAGSAGRGLPSRDPPRPAPEAGSPGVRSSGTWAATRAPFPGSTRSAPRGANGRKIPGPSPGGGNAATVEFREGGPLSPPAKAFPVTL